MDGQCQEGMRQLDRSNSNGGGNGVENGAGNILATHYT